MATDTGLVAWVEEALAPMGSLTRRAMMGGMTIYLDGTIFAIVADDQLWFKADAASDAEWDEAGCPRFTYQMGEGREGSMNYRRAPDGVYDDAEEMRAWAMIAVAAGHRAPARKPRPKA
jgi:DNA transformation protein